MTRWWRSRDALAVGFLIVWPFVFFWQVTLGQGVWFTRDVSRVYHPFAVELARALGEGRLPLWTSLLQGGFPLFAEGQVAALYPPHLLLVKLLPPEFAISIETLLHLAWAAVGIYALVRGMRFGIPSALLAGIAFSFSGFMVQKIYHMPILWTAAWLPWLIFLLDQFQRARRDQSRTAALWFFLITLAMGVQWLAGSAQIALLNSIVVAVFGFFGGLTFNNASEVWRERFKKIPQTILWVALPLLLGGGLGAVQLLPTAELVGYSVRAGGLDQDLLTLYSYSADSLKQFVSPFSQGEPSDDNVELWGYVGITTLIGAATALGFRRDSRTLFFAGLALVALSLTVGDANPLFHLLVQLPVLNLFRVPARYVFLFGFATAILAATTLEMLARRAADPHSWRPTAVAAGVAAAAVLLIIVGAASRSLDFWFGIWQVLPWVLAFLVILTLGLAWMHRIDRGLLSAAMVGLVFVDLSAYAAPFLSTTVARLTPPAYVNQVPHSADARVDASAPGRVYTDETVWPSVPALRSSFYPNYGLVYGRESAHIYSPLALQASENYYFNLSPAMLNLLNVRWFAVPLEPRLTDRGTAPYTSLALDVVDKTVQFAPMATSAIQIDSFTEGAAALPAGSVAANVSVAFADGSTQVFPLHVGVETADWDWGQASGTNAPPRQAQLAHPVSAFVRSVGHSFDGYVYRAKFDLASSDRLRNVVAVGVQSVAVPRARLTIERISLLDAAGQPHSVAALTGKDDFALDYMSDTAAIWQNLDVLPRAFVAHQAEVVSAESALSKLQLPGFQVDQVVLLQEGQPISAQPSSTSPDRVAFTLYQAENLTLTVTTDSDGYLVLADTWFPGCNALVVGKPAPIYRADYAFRAVPLGPGEHTVEFHYRPMSLLAGALVSVASLAVLIAIVLLLRSRL